MFVLSSPSGAGKTTLSRRLLADDGDITLSVSATTRPPRPGEIDGVDYFFVSPERFADMVASDDLLEWATVFGHRYGTPRGPVEAALHEGRDVLFDIDWQGTQQLQQTDAASDLVRVFILPPDMTELERRLHGRATDAADVIAGRMARAQAGAPSLAGVAPAGDDPPPGGLKALRAAARPLLAASRNPSEADMRPRAALPAAWATPERPAPTVGDAAVS